MISQEIGVYPYRLVNLDRNSKDRVFNRTIGFLCKWGGSPGLRPTPSSASAKLVDSRRAGPGAGADQGIRPTKPHEALPAAFNR